MSQCVSALIVFFACLKTNGLETKWGRLRSRNQLVNMTLVSVCSAFSKIFGV